MVVKKIMSVKRQMRHLEEVDILPTEVERCQHLCHGLHDIFT